MVFSWLRECTDVHPDMAVAFAIPFLAFILVAFSALRLAKFNVDERQTSSFIGLPTPANALFWGALVIGAHDKMIALPSPDAIHDEDGERLPATYANFLIINNAVLFPTYAQSENDRAAADVLGKAFPCHEIVGIDCRALIKQHGSLHCVTMQYPRS